MREIAFDSVDNKKADNFPSGIIGFNPNLPTCIVSGRTNIVARTYTS